MPHGFTKQRVYDPIKRDWTHISNFYKRRKKRPDLYAGIEPGTNAATVTPSADNAGGGSGSGNAGMGETVGVANQRTANDIADTANQIAADLAAAETKRKRGRPTGTGTNDANTAVENVFPQGDEETQEGFVILEGSGAQPQPRKKRISKTAVADGAYIADNLLDVINLTAKTFFGNVAEMQPNERAEIEKPLTRILARLDSQVISTAQQFADPVALMFAASAWAIRVRMMRQMQQTTQRSRNENDETPQPMQAEVPIAPMNATETIRVGAHPATVELMRTP